MLHHARKTCGISEVGTEHDTEFAWELRQNHGLAWGCLWAALMGPDDEGIPFDPRSIYHGGILLTKRERSIRFLLRYAKRSTSPPKPLDQYLDEVWSGFSEHGLRQLILGVEYITTVWHPCAVIYRTTPVELRRKARAGDLNSIVDLLRLDKMMRRDREIIRRIEKFRLTGNRAALERRYEHERGKLITKKRDSIAAIKATLGGMVQVLVTGLGESIKVPQIMGAYHALAQAKPGG